jgi:O-antigen ligase/tetratricopeptide (TPR) repeat protein
MKDILKGLVIALLFAVPFLTLYIADSFFFPYITGKNFAFRIIVEAALGLWLVLALLDKTYRPRFSWLLASFGALLVVMLAATLGAKHISTALWSNFERMDGYITLVHVFIYFMLLGTMFKSKTIWQYFLHTSLAVASLVAMKGLAQLSGSSVRVDSTLGNAAYMAIYMLFHIFITMYLFVQTKVTPYRIIYGLLIVMFVYVLLQTGTRGTAIGLAAGSLAMVAYLGLFAARLPQVRRYAFVAVAGLAILFGGFYAVRDTEYIQNTPSLARIANIDLGNDLRIRSIIWGMSLEGVQERPVLGWGNGNFNYVFNAQYDPRLYEQEQWFDRVHNLVLDWLIAGGVLGFLAYVSVFLALFYYLVVRPTEAFSVTERAIIFGLLVGYLTHNLVVFDNIVSYIFFAVILGLLHSRVADDRPLFADIKIPESLTTQIVAPIVVVATIALIYMVNVPGISAARGIITALQTPDLSARLTAFEELLAEDSFGKQEITEQFAQQAMSLATQQVDPAVKEKFLASAEKALADMVTEKPGDARLHVFLASYYRAVGNQERAREELVLAREFSPKKQAIIIQQGIVELAAGNNPAAVAFLKEAYELDTENDEAKEYYVSALMYAGEVETANELVAASDEMFLDRLAQSDFVLSAANIAQNYGLMATLYERRLAVDGSVAQNWASLAYVYYQQSNASGTDALTKKQLVDKAISTLSRGATAVPTFAPTASCVSENLRNGRAPELGCQ